MISRKNMIRGYLLLLLLLCVILYGCREENLSDNILMDGSDKMEYEEADITAQLQKGYDLPVAESEREEAEADCQTVRKLVLENYQSADKGESSNCILSEKVLCQMQESIQRMGQPVTTVRPYANMENYQKLEAFLNASLRGKSGEVIVYEIRSDGSIGRNKYMFDGADMYVLGADMTWNVENAFTVTYLSYTRIKEWTYTDKGWFCYELCVPEPPEVTEIMNGSCMLRVKPMEETLRELSARYVFPLGYQGNNLLCSDWDTTHMEELDYNGLYEYLYCMKYQENFNPENYPDGIPKEEFEGLIMEYLPVTAEQIREYAAFDVEEQMYLWKQLGCANYTPAFFGNAFPEVTMIQEHEDGTVTLIVDAVCDMVICDDAVITHELTVQFAQDGSFRYLGNKIMDDGIRNIPDYQYRITSR